MNAAFLIPHWLLPPFTEQWATTYLQVLFESFLFALGVPTAVYSLVIDADIKRVAQTLVKTRRYFLVTGLLYFAVFLIVWGIHPDPNPPPRCDSRSTQSTAMGSLPGDQKVTNASRESAANELVAPPPIQVNKEAAALGPVPLETAEAPTRAQIFKTIVAAISVTFLPCGVLVMGLRLNRQFKREKVIGNLADTLLETFESNHTLDAVALRDLTYLGEHGKAGDEKGLVLDVIDRLIDRVQKKVREENVTYHGYELESLIRQIPTMLDNSIQPGADQDYARAIEVLANVWRWLSGRKNIPEDALSTREAIKHLALKAVNYAGEDTALAYLEVSADCDSHLVFQIGLAALNADKHLLAVGALSKLEAMATNAIAEKQNPDVRRETRANLLGIAAYLAGDGHSGGLRAEQAVVSNENVFSPSVRKSLVDAFTYHYDAGRFEIADKIKLFETFLTLSGAVDVDRNIPSGDE